MSIKLENFPAILSFSSFLNPQNIIITVYFPKESVSSKYPKDTSKKVAEG